MKRSLNMLLGQKPNTLIENGLLISTLPGGKVLLLVLILASLSGCFSTVKPIPEARPKPIELSLKQPCKPLLLLPDSKPETVLVIQTANRTIHGQCMTRMEGLIEALDKRGL